MAGDGQQHRPMNPETEGSQRRFSNQEEALEIKSLRRIISAFINYSDAAEEDVRRYERSFKKLSHEHKALLSHLPLKYQRLRRCISVNSIFIMDMLQAFDPPFDMSQKIEAYEHGDLENHFDNNLSAQALHLTKDSWTYTEQPAPEYRSTVSGSELSNCSGKCDHALIPSYRNNEKQEISGECSSSLVLNTNTCDCNFKLSDESGNGFKFICNVGSSTSSSIPNGNSPLPADWMETSLRSSVPLVDVDKVRCIIRNIVRDWAVEGKTERDKCYKPILEELIRLFPVRNKERPPSCLVPGAGLGRLALEISSIGFATQGNEFSYYMMICSSFILNHTEVSNQWVIYPWIHSNSNSLSDDDQLRPVSFPDIQPASAGITEGFSMCGGDFVEVYNDVDQEASWDAVVTCFFIDTAHNILEYIDVISKALKEGGYWINLGPLLYHFADSYGPEEELSIEISLEDVKKVAFRYGFVLEMEKMVETTYTANPHSMMQNHYYTAFWTMKKITKS